MNLPAFTPIEESLFLTLCARALDKRSRYPVLGDAEADQIVRTLEYDYTRFRLSANVVVSTAHRAKKLDDVASTFLARNPHAVGLDLGAGLDTRAIRIDPPSTVDWYDIDFPAVIAARQLLIPDRAKAHGVGADLTDPDWLDAIPADRPAVIVADGLMAFLAMEDMVRLLDRLVSHFPTGEIAFNNYTPFTIWAAKHSRSTRAVADLVKSSGMDDPREPERWNPKLRLVREILLTREPEVAGFPPALRRYNRLAAHSTALSRMGTIVLHYRF
jgi:O-methyltransferase involved in polyketide biosynthesis